MSGAHPIEAIAAAFGRVIAPGDARSYAAVHAGRSAQDRVAALPGAGTTVRSE
jgi:hypothetical protein